MVAKDPASAYTPGRTLSWLKVKQRAFAGRHEASIRADTALVLLCLGIDDRLFRRGVEVALV
jgi:ATP-dependent DNA ligase